MLSAPSPKADALSTLEKVISGRYQGLVKELD
jgi:hypothetical protein